MTVEVGRKSRAILVVDDDEEDRRMMREACEVLGLANPLYFVEDGRSCLDFLGRKGVYGDGDSGAAPRPGIIFIDLRLPGMTGFELLQTIKLDPDLRSIPVVVLSTSSSEADVARSYDLGVSGYVRKPVSFDRLLSMLETLKGYWFETVDLPPERR
jgi:CheY-like chemotaxis protein